jgi:hypothetical protein
MSDSIELFFEQLCLAVRQKYGESSQLNLNSLEYILTIILKENPELEHSLQRDERMTQYNRDNVTAFQTAVNGGIVNIGPHFHGINSEELMSVFLTFFNSLYRYNYPSQTYELPEISNFDLLNTVELSRKHIIYNEGLIGLSICCSEPFFYNSLCQRLKQESRRNTQVRSAVSIKSQFNSLEKAVKSFEKYRSALSKEDFICPVLVDSESSNINIVEDFWTQTQNLFVDEKLERKLIIIIVAHQNHKFPSDVFPLPLPEFNKAHVDKWIGKLTSALHTSRILSGCQEIADVWIERMHEHCQCDERTLDISLVYDHLGVILSEVKNLKEQPSMSPHDFLARLYF